MNSDIHYICGQDERYFKSFIIGQFCWGCWIILLNHEMETLYCRIYDAKENWGGGFVPFGESEESF